MDFLSEQGRQEQVDVFLKRARKVRLPRKRSAGRGGVDLERAGGWRWTSWLISRHAVSNAG